MDTVKPTLVDRMRSLKRKCVILELVLRHERTPWYAKVCGILTLAYALSPIDLVPDFIPVLGYLDDLLIVPFGIWLTLKLVPANVWCECEAEAIRREIQKGPKNWRGALLVVFVWLLLLATGLLVARRLLS